jgi:hypothetical protein
MRIAAHMLAVILLCSAVAPASAPQETKPQQTNPQLIRDNSKFRPPNDVSDLLDVCGEALNQLDTPPTQVPSVKS